MTNALARTWLQARLFLRMLGKGKVTSRRLLNLLANSFRYLKRDPVPGTYPSVLMINVTNKCNLYCAVCRKTRTEITDISGRSGSSIPIGSMSLENYEKLMADPASRHAMLAILYVTGEPLLHPDIHRMVRIATEKGMATLISTNGAALTRECAEKLVDSGLDIAKITVSGASQEVHEVFHRGGKIAQVLDGVRHLAESAKKRGSDMIINVDYILFKHNEHEVPGIRAFCEKQGVLMTTRVGYLFEESRTKVQVTAELPRVRRLCDWLWKIMTIDWDGRILPCCLYGYSSAPVILGRFGEGASVWDLWNGAEYGRFRSAHVDRGRGAFPICRDCFLEGVRFQC